MLRDIALGDTVKIGHIEGVVDQTYKDKAVVAIKPWTLDSYSNLKQEVEALGALIDIYAGPDGGRDSWGDLDLHFSLKKEAFYEGADGKWRIKEQQRGDDYPWELL